MACWSKCYILAFGDWKKKKGRTKKVSEREVKLGGVGVVQEATLSSGILFACFGCGDGVGPGVRFENTANAPAIFFPHGCKRLVVTVARFGFFQKCEAWFSHLWYKIAE